MAQSEAFKQAVIDSKKLTSKPSNDELLELYGKQSLRSLHHHRNAVAYFCIFRSFSSCLLTGIPNL